VGGRQRHSDLQPALVERHHADGTAVRVADRPHDRQSEPGATGSRALPATPTERLEQARDVRLIELESGVAHDQAHVIALGPGTYPDPAVEVVVAHCVLDQVAGQSVQEAGVAHDRRWVELRAYLQIESLHLL